jgi:hypothetical protein
VHINENKTKVIFEVAKVGTLVSGSRTSAVVLLHHLELPNFAFAPLQPLLLVEGGTSKRALPAFTKSAEEIFLNKETYSRPRAPTSTVSALCKPPTKQGGRGGKGHNANARRGGKNTRANQRGGTGKGRGKSAEGGGKGQGGSAKSDSSRGGKGQEGSAAESDSDSGVHIMEHGGVEQSHANAASSHDDENKSVTKQPQAGRHPAAPLDQKPVSTESDSDGGARGRKRPRSPEPSESALIGGTENIIDRLLKVVNNLTQSANKEPESVPVQNFPQGHFQHPYQQQPIPFQSPYMQPQHQPQYYHPPTPGPQTYYPYSQPPHPAVQYHPPHHPPYQPPYQPPYHHPPPLYHPPTPLGHPPHGHYAPAPTGGQYQPLLQALALGLQHHQHNTTTATHTSTSLSRLPE